jgi:hypothetical protein
LYLHALPRKGLFMQTFNEHSLRAVLQKWWIVLPFLSGVFLTGCMARTVISGGEKSPSQRYFAYVWVYGAPGKPFGSITPKTVTLSVREEITKGDKKAILYHKCLQLDAAGDLGWECAWTGETNIVFRLSDYGELYWPRARQQGLKPRWETAVPLFLNVETEVFEEHRADHP